MDSAFQLAGMFWNYALSVRDGEVDRKLEKEIVKGAKSILGLNIDDIQRLLNKIREN